MTTSPILLPAAGPGALPPGLTADDLDRIITAVAAERAASTRVVYALAWRAFERWCTSRDASPLPADPAVVCAYLTDRASQGKTTATLNVACAAVGFEHTRSGLPNPVADQAVARVRRGLRRIVGVAPRYQARPLLGTDIRSIVQAIDPGTAIGRRDRALILVGFAAALRRTELATLALEDIEHTPAGILLTIPRSKGDQEGAGQIVAVAAGDLPDTDPVGALRAWLALRGSAPGNVFTRIAPHDRATTEALGGATVNRVIQERARTAGLPADRISAHSLRAGHATTAAMAGAPLASIAAQTRHRDLSTLVQHYIRPIEAMESTSSRSLGL